MKKILIAGLGIFLFVGISACQKKSKIEAEIIDYNSFTEEAMDERIIDTASIQYVLLRFPIGDQKIRNIDRIKIRNKKIYVSDFRSGTLLVFDMQGNPISPIGRRGRGPGEYLNMADFDIDAQENIHIIDGNADKLLIYDSDYEYVRETKLPFEIDIIKCLPESKYLLELSSWNTGRTADNQIVICDMELNILSVEKKYERDLVDDNVWLSAFHFITVGNEVFFNRPIDDYVKVFSSEGAYQRQYYYDFGSLSVPHDYRKNVEPIVNELTKYQFLLNFNVVMTHNAYGTISDKGTTKDYMIDRKNNKNYTRVRSANDLIGDLISISDNKIIREITDIELFSDRYGINVDSVSHILSLAPLP
jgi:hypothetical protein